MIGNSAVKIKKFIVESMKEAIEKIREELGPDAVILHSRKTVQHGTGGNGQPMIEVTAAVEEHSSEDAMSGWTDRQQAASATIGGVFRELPDLNRKSNERRAVDFLISDKNEDNRPSKAAKPKSNSRKPAGMTRNPEAIPEISMKLSQVHQSMLYNEVDEFVAESLVKTAMEESRLAKGDDLLADCLPRSLESFVGCSGPIETTGPGPKVVALIGPTGVGKTTTAAKLATNMTVLEHKSVVLVTVDIQRTSSVQQLKTYAEMLQVPFEIALNPVELRRAVRKHSDADVILIDTAGRSPYKWISILELASFFKGIEDLEIHLVLSAATNVKENLSAVERFGALAISRLLFTKIDEIGGYGPIVNVASLCRKPISYLATGQSIPDDIEIATSERILQLVSKPREGKL